MHDLLCKTCLSYLKKFTTNLKVLIHFILKLKKLKIYTSIEICTFEIFYYIPDALIKFWGGLKLMYNIVTCTCICLGTTC